MSATIKLTGEWPSLKALLDPRRTRAEVDLEAIKALAKVAKKIARSALERGGLDANSQLTQILKGRDDPAKDTGEMMAAIRVIVLPQFRGVWVGIPKGHRKSKLAELVHDGATIPVTEAMRAMFRLLWQASEGKIDPQKLTGRAAALWKVKQSGWLPLKADTEHIVIVERPFMSLAFQDLRGVDAIGDALQAAVHKALRSRMRSKK